MPKLTRKTVIGIKTETTQGTGVSLAATDYILAQDVSISPTVDPQKRDYQRESISPIPHVIGIYGYEITFKTECMHSATGGATVFAPLGAALQACGMTETSGNARVLYAPTSTIVTNFLSPGKSATIEVYLDGIKHVAAGCLGSYKLVLEAGKIPMFEFTFKGLYYSAPSDTAFPSTTFNTRVPAVIGSVTVTLDSDALCMNKVEVDYANEIVDRMCQSAIYNGLNGYMLTGRSPKITFDPELETVATHAFMAEMIAGTNIAAVWSLGATTSKVSFTAQGQYSSVTPGDRNGIRTVEVAMDLRETVTTNDEFLLTFGTFA